MSEKKTDMPEREWSTAELVAAMRICHSGEGGCEGCPMAPFDSVRCSSMETMAADRLEELAAQVKRLTEATEKAAEEKARKLVDMAKEANTALERGLHGVNQAQLAEMTAVQSDLAELGRESVIRTEPVPTQDGSQRIAEVNVGGVRVFGAEAEDFCETEYISVCTMYTRENMDGAVVFVKDHSNAGGDVDGGPGG